MSRTKILCAEQGLGLSCQAVSFRTLVSLSFIKDQIPMLALPFPSIDPVLVSVGPISIRWYALAYVFGFVFAWKYCERLASANKAGPSPALYDEFLTWGVLGTLLGGRIGYVLFYQPTHYLEDMLEIFRIWHGGMSFHGGMLGVIFAMILFARKRKVPFFAFSDLWACATPIGLFLGRIANFINGELFGRVTDVPWAFVFPHGGELPRHASQLYEAGLEGLVLFMILGFMARSPWIRARYGILSGAFLALYGLFRYSVEFVREPDPQLGFLYAGATMGQLLCLPMILIGISFIVLAMKRKRT